VFLFSQRLRLTPQGLSVLHLSVLAAMRRLAALGRDSFTAQARTAPRAPPPPKTPNPKA